MLSQSTYLTSTTNLPALDTPFPRLQSRNQRDTVISIDGCEDPLTVLPKLYGVCPLMRPDGRLYSGPTVAGKDSVNPMRIRVQEGPGS